MDNGINACDGLIVCPRLDISFSERTAYFVHVGDDRILNLLSGIEPS